MLKATALDAPDTFDQGWSRSAEVLGARIQGLQHADTVRVVMEQALESKAKYETLNVSMLFTMLTEPDKAEYYWSLLESCVRDDFRVMSKNVGFLCRDRFHRLKPHCQRQLIWIIQNLVRVGSLAMHDIVALLLRQIRTGHQADHDHGLQLRTIRLLAAHHAWVIRSDDLIQRAVMVLLRIIAEHHLISTASETYTEGVALVDFLLRQNFQACMALGQELVRALHGVTHIEAFTALWRDIMFNPASLTPSFTGIEQLMGIVAPRHSVMTLISRAMEEKLVFMMTRLTTRSDSAHFEWFEGLFFSHKSTCDLLICDMIRYVIVCYHPDNATLASNTIKRWEILDWLVRNTTSIVGSQCAKLCLFLDWLIFQPGIHNIMNTEASMLLLKHFVERDTKNAVSLLEFLALIVQHFLPTMQERLVEGITNTFAHAADKGMIKSVHTIIHSKSLHPFVIQVLDETFPELATMVRKGKLGKTAAALSAAAQAQKLADELEKERSSVVQLSSGIPQQTRSILKRNPPSSAAGPVGEERAGPLSKVAKVAQSTTANQHPLQKPQQHQEQRHSQQVDAVQRKPSESASQISETDSLDAIFSSSSPPPHRPTSKPTSPLMFASIESQPAKTAQVSKATGSTSSIPTSVSLGSISTSSTTPTTTTTKTAITTINGAAPPRSAYPPVIVVPDGPQGDEDGDSDDSIIFADISSSAKSAEYNPELAGSVRQSVGLLARFDGVLERLSNAPRPRRLPLLQSVVAQLKTVLHEAPDASNAAFAAGLASALAPTLSIELESLSEHTFHFDNHEWATPSILAKKLDAHPLLVVLQDLISLFEKTRKIQVVQFFQNLVAFDTNFRVALLIAQACAIGATSSVPYSRWFYTAACSRVDIDWVDSELTVNDSHLLKMIEADTLQGFDFNNVATFSAFIILFSLRVPGMVGHPQLLHVLCSKMTPQQVLWLSRALQGRVLSLLAAAEDEDSQEDDSFHQHIIPVSVIREKVGTAEEARLLAISLDLTVASLSWDVNTVSVLWQLVSAELGDALTLNMFVFTKLLDSTMAFQNATETQRAAIALHLETLARAVSLESAALQQAIGAELWLSRHIQMSLFCRWLQTKPDQMISMFCEANTTVLSRQDTSATTQYLQQILDIEASMRHLSGPSFTLQIILETPSVLTGFKQLLDTLPQGTPLQESYLQLLQSAL
eukprot:m.306360 g.306360  ORF g.306360 m.306360 type:complete len:1189 (+) comp15920_c0_seq8:70-3636(+)